MRKVETINYQIPHDSKLSRPCLTAQRLYNLGKPNPRQRKSWWSGKQLHEQNLALKKRSIELACTLPSP